MGSEHIAAYEATAALAVGLAVDLHAKSWQRICPQGGRRPIPRRINRVNQEIGSPRTAMALR